MIVLSIMYQYCMQENSTKYIFLRVLDIPIFSPLNASFYISDFFL